MSSHELVAILDAGSQYGKVIDRRVRELNVETELLPITTSADSLRSKYKAVIISGGPQSVYDPSAPLVDSHIFELGVPVLGICYGMQLMSFQNGRQVGKKTSREDGQFWIDVDTSSALYANLEAQQSVLLTHGDTVFEAPEGWKVTAKSGSLIASIENPSKRLYGVQFHPEVDLTVHGVAMFRNFLFGICGLSASFTLKDRKATAVEYIRSKVGPEAKVLVLVSGGVDSSVCAALCTLALGPDRVHALHICNGFMRKNESARVKEALARLNLNLQVVDASETFYAATTKITRPDGTTYFTESLDTTINPEEKRKIIGDTFMHVAQAEIARLGLKAESTFLAQGTLRPDLIESASHSVSKAAEVIKTHHNDTDLVRELRRKGHVIEPLADYHKDEVRALGRSLGLPDDLVSRHPFPGPGLAIRIICCDEKPSGGLDEEFHATNAKLHHLLQEFNPDDDLSSTSTPTTNTSGSAPAELAELREDEREVLRRLIRTRHVSALLLPLKTVGVQGDGRSYKFACALSSDRVNIGAEEKATKQPAHHQDHHQGHHHQSHQSHHPSHQIPTPQQQQQQHDVDDDFFNPHDWNDLFSLAKLLPKIYHNINRVVYVFGKRVTQPITQLTPTKLTKDVIEQLQEADDTINQVFIERDQLKNMSQAPIILVPVAFDNREEEQQKRSVAIRTLITNDFMTGHAAIPGQHIDADALLECVRRCSKIQGISRVLYDLTSKPPATTEWE